MNKNKKKKINSNKVYKMMKKVKILKKFNENMKNFNKKCQLKSYKKHSNKFLNNKLIHRKKMIQLTFKIMTKINFRQILTIK